MFEEFDDPVSEEQEEPSFLIHRAIELLVRHRRNTHRQDSLRRAHNLTDSDIDIGKTIIDVDLKEILLGEYVRCHAEANGVLEATEIDGKTLRIMTYVAWQLTHDLASSQEIRTTEIHKDRKKMFARWETWKLADAACEIFTERKERQPRINGTAIVIIKKETQIAM